MLHLLLFVVLTVFILFYFRIAEHYQIIDKPNDRSSHTEITIRGGGIIFPLAMILYSLITKDIPYLLLGGVLAISLVSFLDDLYTLPNRIRIVIHLLSVSALIFVVGGFSSWPFWLIPIVYILIIGCINAYNFMDGINGITGLYSLVGFCSLYYIDKQYHFIDLDFISIAIIACVVFLFFNFRNRARCFAGDVGSISIAFWIISLLVLLIVRTGDLKYVLFLSVYGVDAILTIVHRLILKQNIFSAHRSHFYQILANDCGVPHLWVSVIYSLIQLVVNLIVIYSSINFFILFLLLNLPLCLSYILLKSKLKGIKNVKIKSN